VTPDDVRGLDPAAQRVVAYAAGVLATPVGPDQPSHVVGLAALDAVPDELRQQQHATPFAPGEVTGVDGPRALAVPVTTRHADAVELLEGRTLLADLDGVVVLGQVRLPLQGPLVRFALGVARSGAEVHGMQPDDDPASIELVPADRALDPDPDPTHDGAVLSGRLVAATRRYLRLPTAPPTPTPWLLLCDVWATLAHAAYDRAGRTGGDPQRLAWDAVALRPDVALATQRRTRAHLREQGGPPPTAVDLRDAYAEPSPALAALLPHRAALQTHDPVAAMQAFEEQVLDELADDGALWDATCVLFPAPEDGPVAAPEWFDGPALLRHVARVEQVEVGATQRLLTRDDVPRWLREGTARLATHAEQLGPGTA